MELLIGLFVAGLVVGLILGWLASKWWYYQWIYPLEFDEATQQVRQHKVQVRRQKGE